MFIVSGFSPLNLVFGYKWMDPGLWKYKYVSRYIDIYIWYLDILYINDISIYDITFLSSFVTRSTGPDDRKASNCSWNCQYISISISQYKYLYQLYKYQHRPVIVSASVSPNIGISICMNELWMAMRMRFTSLHVGWCAYARIFVLCWHKKSDIGSFLTHSPSYIGFFLNKCF